MIVQCAGTDESKQMKTYNRTSINRNSMGKQIFCRPVEKKDQKR